VLEVTSLGSGSSGNALLVRTGGAAILIDCGVGVRRMVSGLATRGIAMSDVNAVLVSHEHSDHIRELWRHTASGTPVFSTRGTALAAGVPSPVWTELSSTRPIALAEFEVVAIPVSHDAADPCGFLIRTPQGSVTVITDCGVPSAAAAEAIAESALVVLEANHDEGMLRRGPYPVHLQRRILSDAGHLSNAACARQLASALRNSRRLPSIWLAHLSETNNRPALARKTVQQELARAGIHVDVQALPRRETSATWSAADARYAVAQLSLGFK
jgi:phosphoribosyl 1,2-cyclic phosphodiesterase